MEKIQILIFKGALELGVIELGHTLGYMENIVVKMNQFLVI